MQEHIFCEKAMQAVWNAANLLDADHRVSDGDASARQSQSESGAGSDVKVGSDALCNRRMSPSLPGSDADDDQEEYWDEEDELGDYIKRQAARETQPHKEKGPSQSGRAVIFHCHSCW